MTIIATKQIDENGVDFGLKRTGNVPHVIVDSSLDQYSFENKPWMQALAEGLIDGYTYVEKFGENPEVDISTAPEDIWSYGGLYTFSTTADIDTISSSDVSDTATITLIGLDSSWNEVTQIVTLNGQTKVSLTTNLVRLYRMYNSGSTALTGTVYCYVNDTISSGVPTTDANVRAIIPLDAEQTEMCIYTVPAGKTGYIYGGYISMSRSNRDAVTIVTFRQRTFGGVFRVTYRISILGEGTGSWQYHYSIPLKLAAKTDLIVRCDAVSTNNMGLASGFTVLVVDD